MAQRSTKLLILTAPSGNGATTSTNFLDRIGLIDFYAIHNNTVATLLYLLYD